MRSNGRLVKEAKRAWRQAARWLSSRDWRLSPRERDRRSRLVAQVSAAVDEPWRIAVISRKGGVGKTTTTLMLGHTFASCRNDRVVALDGNPDAGSLAYRVPRDSSATLSDLLRDEPHIAAYRDLRAYTNRAPTGLEVVASDDDALVTQGLGEEEYVRAIHLLERYYDVVLLDTGTGILDSATQGILRTVDQIVVVVAPNLDGARAASLTLDWLDRNGYDWLVRGAVAVVNQVQGRGMSHLGEIQEHFGRRCRAIVGLPWDAHLDAGAESDLNQVAKRTRDAYLELAATVAEGFDQVYDTHASV